MCGVERVTEECQENSFSLPEVTPTNCSATIIRQKFVSITCSATHIEAILRDIPESCKSIQQQEVNDNCRVNANGKYCKTFTDLRSLLLRANSVCQDDSSICDPVCVSTLQTHLVVASMKHTTAAAVGV